MQGKNVWAHNQNPEEQKLQDSEHEDDSFVASQELSSPTNKNPFLSFSNDLDKTDVRHKTDENKFTNQNKNFKESSS